MVSDNDFLLLEGKIDEVHTRLVEYEHERKEFSRKWEDRAFKILLTVGTGVSVSIICDLLK